MFWDSPSSLGSAKDECTVSQVELQMSTDPAIFHPLGCNFCEKPTQKTQSITCNIWIYQLFSYCCICLPELLSFRWDWHTPLIKECLFANSFILMCLQWTLAQREGEQQIRDQFKQVIFITLIICMWLQTDFMALFQWAEPEQEGRFFLPSGTTL